MVSTEARILCVDDEPGLLGIMSHFLEGTPGFKVDTATTAKQALTMLQAQEYDALVADYLMPEMSGLELLKEVRGRKNDIPFIILTGKGNEDIAVDALNIGADFYVQKTGDPKQQFTDLANMIKQSVLQRRSQNSLLKTTQTLQAVVQASPVPIYAIDPHGIVLMWNRAAERVFGWKIEEVLGKPIPIVPQDALDEFKALRGRVLEGESFAGVELRRLRKDGRIIDIMLSTAPLRDERGRISGIMASAQEITEHKALETKLMKVNRLYSFLSSANAAIVRLKTREALFGEICKIAVEKGGFRTAWVGILDEATREVKPVAMYGMTEGVGTAYRIIADNVPEGQGPTGKATRMGRLFLSSDIDKDPDMAIWREHATKHGIRSAAAIPIRLKGKVIGAFAIYAGEADFFREDEKALLEEVGSDVSFALDAIARDEARRRVQSALKREAAFTSTTLDTAGALIVVIDNEGKIVRFNREGEQVTKYKADEVVGRNLWDVLIPPEDVEKVKQMFSKIVAGDYPVECECEWLAKDGSRRMIDWTNTALPERDGSVKFVIATGVDVTEKRRAEEALRKSEEELRLVTDNMTDLLTRIDAAGNYVYVSPSHKVQTGWEPRDLIGRSFLDFVHPDDADKVLESIRQHLESKDLTGTMQFRFKRADGRYVWVESTGSGLLDKDGKVVGGVFGTRDISERKEAEEKLEKRTLEAEAAKTKAQLFLDFMSHDIVNIVTPMLTYANLISENAEVPPEIKKYSSKIEAQGRKVGQFTTSVRKVSHAEMESYAGFQPLDVKATFEEGAEAVAAEYPQKTVDVRYSLPKGKVMVPGAGHLEDIVYHLLENAVKHTKEKNVVIDVEVKPSGGTWEIAISDNGPGIPDSKKKMIVLNSLLTQSTFERGIASGLSFANLILEQLGGGMRIEDRAEGGRTKGARIVLNLPRVIDEI